MYLIGEVAQLASVSKRTIDYYTKIGLLHAERSDSNYRYYEEDVLLDLKFIEKCKKSHLPLECIKEKMERMKECTDDNQHILQKAEQLEQHMEQLKIELSELMPLIEKLDREGRISLSTRLSPHSKLLIQSLLSFT